MQTAQKIKKVVDNFFRNPVSFIVRQLYRVVVVLPFHLVVYIMSALRGQNSAIEDKEPSSFCFIITSIIYTKGGKIQYQSPRSIFSAEERVEQTLKTIESIRTKIPAAKIVLVEAGLRRDVPYALDKKVDQYVYVGDKQLVRLACDSRYKSLGEIMLLAYAEKQITEEADFYFKISGRYWLNEQFNLNNWKKGEFVLQYIQPDYVCTRLYGFRREARVVWKDALLKGIPLAIAGYAVENVLAKYIPRNKVHELAVLGVSGIGASSNVVAKD